MADYVVLTGFKELETKLLALAPKIAKKCLAVSVYAGAKIFQVEAKRLAPLFTGKVQDGHPPAGQLKRDLIVKHANEKSNLYQQTYLVTVRRGKKYKKVSEGGKVTYLNAYYARWVESGHFYVPPNPNEKVSSSGVAHKSNWKDWRAAAKSAPTAKWVAAKPFMRPAFDAKYNEAMQAMKEKLGRRIEEEAAK